MQTEILIASYKKDIPYLQYNLRTIAKFCAGFSGVAVAVPLDDLTDFLNMDHCGLNPRFWTYERDPDPQKWQIHAQAIKCMADVICPDADYVLHTDSDCIFTAPVKPEDYFREGKPYMLMEDYGRLPKDFPWKPVVDRALQIDCQYEFMRRHPQVNPRGVYSDLRTEIQLKHGKPLESWVLEQKPTFPWGFTEHNTIGAFAYYDPFWHDEYYWWDVAKMPAPEPRLVQFWSHSPPEKPQGTPQGLQLTPLELINKVLA